MLIRFVGELVPVGESELAIATIPGISIPATGISIVSASKSSATTSTTSIMLATRTDMTVAPSPPSGIDVAISSQHVAVVVNDPVSDFAEQ